MTLDKTLEVVLVVGAVLCVLIIVVVLCSLAIRAKRRYHQCDDEPLQTADQKALSKQTLKSIQTLLSRIDFDPGTRNYTELPIDEAQRHARVVTSAVVSLYSRCHEAGEVYSDEFRQWLDVDADVMCYVLTGLFRWGDRKRINEVIVDQLEKRGVRFEFLEDAFDTSSATGQAPVLTDDEIASYYYLPS